MLRVILGNTVKNKLMHNRPYPGALTSGLFLLLTDLLDWHIFKLEAKVQLSGRVHTKYRQGTQHPENNFIELWGIRRQIGSQVEHLSSIHKALASVSNTIQNQMWLYTPIFLACGRKTGESKIQDHLQFHSEFNASLFYMRSCFKRQQEKINQLEMASLPCDDLAGCLGHSSFTTRMAPGFLHLGPFGTDKLEKPRLPYLEKPHSTLT